MTRRITTVIAAPALALTLASSASANTAKEAFDTPLDNAELGRPCGNGLSSSFDWNCPIEAGALVQRTARRRPTKSDWVPGA
jgi:hypothetical protein